MLKKPKFITPEFPGEETGENKEANVENFTENRSATNTFEEQKNAIDQDEIVQLAEENKEIASTNYISVPNPF